MICDLPNKLTTSLLFNLALYFMTNLRRTPSAFFTFYLFSFACVLAMSMFFRTLAATSRTLSQALAPAAVLILALIIYTGFTVPIGDMHPWFRWINYIDPVAYAFESIMINEFHNRRFPCSTFVPTGPGYTDVASDQHVCSTVGAVAGVSYVEGDAYLLKSFQYVHSHLWRNLGVIVALTFFLCGTYLFATEFISAQRSKGEVLVFPRGQVPALAKKNDEEEQMNDRQTAQGATAEKTVSGREVPPSIQKQTAIFHWDSVNYDIKVKGGTRRLLDDVDGWVKPGTLTALMGASGAGKTTLLDVLASRVTMGVVTGKMLVNGRQRDSGFQRKTGYVQQQDLHLSTSTVREALNFSALLRQPKTTPRKEKLAYVDEVVKVLEMEAYADAVVGVPGEGLNVEQRKRLTIGVELAAKPALLLFLDEPTSGLDSQTAWSICNLLRKLANNGQAILCTIHQPSAILFQSFDRLLFLASGGRTVYFGDIGENSRVLTNYFERNGSRICGEEENPAEWMLDVIGAAPGSQNTTDWPQEWRDSPEKQDIRTTLAEMKVALSKEPVDKDSTALREFAEPFSIQILAVTQRVFQQYWRTPSYLYSKTVLCAGSALFIGFSFWDSAVSLQGLQNQLFSIFMMMTIFGNLTQQIMPHFVTQRSLFEVRERPAKTYSWTVFMLSNIIVELPWNTLMAIIIFFCWYYPIGMFRNAIPANQLHERGGLMFLLVFAFLIFTSTFTDMVVAGIETAETAGNIAQLLFSLTLIFCG
jgi:ATP-binding cassette subfamily G (WHITE) protein 2 (PDR)